MIKVSFDTDIKNLAENWEYLQKEVNKTNPEEIRSGLTEHINHCMVCLRNLPLRSFVELLHESSKVNIYSAMLWKHFTSRHNGYTTSRERIAFDHPQKIVACIMSDPEMDVYRYWLSLNPSERVRSVPNTKDEEVYKCSLRAQ